MKKKGFVLLETISMLLVIVVSLSILLLSYSLIVRNSKSKLYYDKVSDKYMLYSMYEITNELLSSVTNLSISKVIDDLKDIDGINLNIDESNNLYGMIYDYDVLSNMPNDIGEACKEIRNKTGLKYAYIALDIDTLLKGKNAKDIYINGAIEYMKTLKKCNEALNNGKCNNPKHYIIGVFYRNNKYYYASIEI